MNHYAGALASMAVLWTGTYLLECNVNAIMVALTTCRRTTPVP
jgi:hypothetical protein